MSMRGVSCAHGKSSSISPPRMPHIVIYKISQLRRKSKERSRLLSFEYRFDCQCHRAHMLENDGAVTIPVGR